MRKIILQEWLSLDGFAAGENNNLDFVTSRELNKYSDNDVLDFMEEIDTILLGRITYELFVDFWPAATTDTEIIADKLNSTGKVIVSNTLSAAPWGKWPDAQVLKGDAIEGVKNLKSKPGKNIVLWGSLSLAQSLMKENLIDDYQLRICPVTVGSGKTLFTAVSNHSNFKLVDFKKYDSGLIMLHYKPM